MVEIADSIVNDYICAEKLKNFCKKHEMKISENKKELFNKVIEYAGEDVTQERYMEVYNWLLESIKEGSKQFCFKRIIIDENVLEHLDDIVLNKYPYYNQSDVIKFKNSDVYKLVNYHKHYDENNILERIEFIFSKFMLEGDIENKPGRKVIYPIYIEVYIKENFIVGRGKSKTTLYECNEAGIVLKENKAKVLDDITFLLSRIIILLNGELIDLSTKHRWQSMLFKLYQKYSFIPLDVDNKVRSLEEISKQYIKEIFRRMELKNQNIPSAIKDIEIFLEKYISINGDMIDVFKEDREAYLIKISSDDAKQMTKIDTASSKEMPLQCTDVFYDGKKYILDTQMCKRLNLCYNRKRGYLTSFTAQFSVIKKDWGYLKMSYFPEEVDIQNVLQTIFENY